MAGAYSGTVGKLRKRDTDIHSVTSADVPHSEHMSGKERRYIISMTIRTICFVAMVFTPSPWRWGFAAGAILLPYIAVILANDPGRPKHGGPSPFGREAIEGPSAKKIERD